MCFGAAQRAFFFVNRNIKSKRVKIILSRKGFDSSYGGIPSPIMPDGTLLSMPIPSDVETDRTYSELMWNGMRYSDIIRSLSPGTRIEAGSHCHLDPDIRADVVDRPDGWRSAFGQEMAALVHLCNHGVGLGDIFLFFGWFRQTELSDGRLRYVQGAPDLHIIYGYLQAGDMIAREGDVPEWLAGHPHNTAERWKRGRNAIYVAAERLSIQLELAGAGCLTVSDRLVLTKKGCSRRVWDLPDFMRNVPMTYNADAWQEDGFVSAARGQEFVFDANNDVIDWVKDMLLSGSR